MAGRPSSTRAVRKGRHTQNYRNSGRLCHGATDVITPRRSSRIANTRTHQERSLNETAVDQHKHKKSSVRAKGQVAQLNPPRRKTHKIARIKTTEPNHAACGSPPPQPTIVKRPYEDKDLNSSLTPGPQPKRLKTPTSPDRKSAGWNTIGLAIEEVIDKVRVDIWKDEGILPTEEQEEVMDRFRAIAREVLPRKRSVSRRRKRSDTGSNTESVLSRTPSDQQPRELKSAPYKHPRYEGQLKERGSFMSKHKEGMSANSRKLCEKLLTSPQTPPKDSLFDDDLFEHTLELIKGRNETKVMRVIIELIFPPVEILALRGAKHLNIIRETTNAGWNNCIPFCGSRPQPDRGVGYKREEFSNEQLQKLQPFIGNELEHCSHFAATYDMYFPFFSCEVKCGASALDVADRQNQHTLTVAMRGLVELFRLVGRENELHREVIAIGCSHSDVDVRYWAYYPFINGKDTTYHREPIAKFDIEKTPLADHRWIGWTIGMNILDHFAPDLFKKICSAIDLIPSGLDFETLTHPEFQHSDEISQLRSGLSQYLDDSSLTDERMVPDSEQGDVHITPATTVQEDHKRSRKT